MARGELTLGDTLCVFRKRSTRCSKIERFDRGIVDYDLRENKLWLLNALVGIPTEHTLRCLPRLARSPAWIRSRSVIELSDLSLRRKTDEVPPSPLVSGQTVCCQQIPRQ